MAKRPFNKYEYYEASVQTPEEHVMIYDQMFRHARGEKALILREDFCGTFLISCAWIQSDPKRKAIGIDLDPEPIAYGKKHGFKKLKPAEKKAAQAFAARRKGVHSLTETRRSGCG